MSKNGNSYKITLCILWKGFSWGIY